MATPVRDYNQQNADGSWVHVTEYDDGTYSSDPIGASGYGDAGISGGGGTGGAADYDRIIASGIYGSDVARQIASMNDQTTRWKSGMDDATRRYLAQFDADTQMKMLQLNLKYQYDRLNLLDIPAMQQLDARARHQMAQDAAVAYADLSGWIPAGFEDKFINGIQTLTNVSAEKSGLVAPQMTSDDMASIKQQLQGAGWGGGSDDDAIKAFLQVAGNDPSQQALVGRLRGGTGVQAATAGAAGVTQPAQAGMQALTPGGQVPSQTGGQMQPLTPGGQMPSQPGGGMQIQPVAAPTAPATGSQWQPFQPIAPTNVGAPPIPSGPDLARNASGSWVNQQGQTPTMAGAQQLANPRTLGQNLDILGMGASFGTGAQTTANLPNLKAGQQPTLAMQQMMGDPSKVAQSLIAGGKSPQEAARFLAGTKLYNQIAKQAPGYFGGATGASGSPFRFFQGKAMPVQDMLKWLRTGDPRAQAVTGMASFAGQDPNQFMSSFFDYLPKGGKVGPTSFR